MRVTERNRKRANKTQQNIDPTLWRITATTSPLQHTTRHLRLDTQKHKLNFNNRPQPQPCTCRLQNQNLHLRRRRGDLEEENSVRLVLVSQ